MKKLEYHAFRKPKKLKNGKLVHRWYYYWIDETGKQYQKSCGTKIKKRQDAEDFIRTLSSPPRAAVAAIIPSSGDIYAKPVRAFDLFGNPVGSLTSLAFFRAKALQKCDF